ncbi:hypothetical protein JW916_16105 [Candidatus Sumerlaeota bacterium]|nr:hypothetical protein [Candidatus Sumerlaeota bacterium]
MDAVYPAPESLYVRLDMTVSRRFLPGRDSLMIQMLSRPPDRVVVEVGQRGLVGGILRLTQVGDDAAALLIKDARHFRGQVGELAERPDLFFGIEPLDLARLLTAGHDAAEILKRPAADDWVLREPTWLRRDWLLETGLGSNRRVQYRIRPRDGLVCEIRLLDAKERWSVRSEFRSYERFGDALFPNRFDIRFRKPAVRARTSVQSLNPTPRPGVADPFSLEPPEGVESGSFREWFDRLAPTR